MEGLLQKLIESFWLKYKSIPIMVLISAFVCLNCIPEKQDGNYIKLFCAIGICFLITLVYSALCINKNRLPRAKRKAKAVLFVIDTETDRFYDDVKYKLGSNFDDYINHSSLFSFTPLYIKKNSLPHYDFYDKQGLLSLVEKTRTMFVVDIKYRVDDISQAENFEIRVNLGVVHPMFTQTYNQIIANDLTLVQRPVSKKRFRKNDLLEQFDVTAQQLSLICKYLIGLVLLLQQQTESACNLLRESYELSKSLRSTVNDPIFRFIEKRFVLSCLICANLYIDHFVRDKDLSYLDKMNVLLEEINSIYPGLPQYYSKKAYYEIAKNRDSKAAEEFVNKEKSIASSKVWKYSEAFLTAYNGLSPLQIYRKYNSAFKIEYNLLYIADYIEFVLQNEPERVGLFLAAALVYEEIGDKQLAHYYYERYQSVNNNDKFEPILQDRLERTSN